MKSSDQFIHQQEVEYQDSRLFNWKQSALMTEYTTGKLINQNKKKNNAHSSNKQQSATRTNTIR